MENETTEKKDKIEEKNINEAKKCEKNNDIYLQDYLKFKKEFFKISLVLGVKFNKNATSRFAKILKQ
jgi:hypothetical protein